MRGVRRAAVICAGVLLIGAAPAAAQECDPFGPAAFRGQVPTPKQVIGIDLGERDVTTAESDRYVQAVDGASDRVVSSVARADGAGARPALRDRRPPGPGHAARARSASAPRPRS